MVSFMDKKVIKLYRIKNKQILENSLFFELINIVQFSLLIYNFLENYIFLNVHILTYNM